MGPSGEARSVGGYRHLLVAGTGPTGRSETGSPEWTGRGPSAVFQCGEGCRVAGTIEQPRRGRQVAEG